jgi:hypothetical protein
MCLVSTTVVPLSYRPVCLFCDSERFIFICTFHNERPNSAKVFAIIKILSLCVFFTQFFLIRIENKNLELFRYEGASRNKFGFSLFVEGNILLDFNIDYGILEPLETLEFYVYRPLAL